MCPPLDLAPIGKSPKFGHCQIINYSDNHYFLRLKCFFLTGFSYRNISRVNEDWGRVFSVEFGKGLSGLSPIFITRSMKLAFEQFQANNGINDDHEKYLNFEKVIREFF